MPAVDAHALMDVLISLCCELFPLFGSRGEPGPGVPALGLGTLSVNRQSATSLSPRAQVGTGSCQRAVGGKAPPPGPGPVGREPSPAPAPPAPAGAGQQELPPTAADGIEAHSAQPGEEACWPRISCYGNSLPQEVIRLKI